MKKDSTDDTVDLYQIHPDFMAFMKKHGPRAQEFIAPVNLPNEVCLAIDDI